MKMRGRFPRMFGGAETEWKLDRAEMIMAPTLRQGSGRFRRRRVAGWILLGVDGERSSWLAVLVR